MAIQEQRQDSSGRSVTGSNADVALIGRNMTIKGRVQSEQDLYIEGEFQGTLEVGGSRLTIGPNAKVVAGSRVRELEVLGSLDGNVESTEKVSVRNGGRLVGNVKTTGILIEDGAYFKGSIDIVLKPETPVVPEASSPE